MTEPTPDSDRPPDTDPADSPDRRRLNTQHLKSMRDGLLGRSDAEAATGGASTSEAPSSGAPSPETGPAGDPPVVDGSAQDPIADSAALHDLDEVFAALRADLDEIDLDLPITVDEQSPRPSGDQVSGDLDQVAAERDSFLDDLQRVSAEFANYRRQTERRVEEAAERKLINLVEKLLPALDALDSAVDQGAIDIEPVRVVLLNALEKEGLERLQPLGEEFDPNWHDAVMREDGDGDVIEVVEVLRAGYGWRGQVVRAAMVKVRG